MLIKIIFCSVFPTRHVDNFGSAVVAVAVIPYVAIATIKSYKREER